MRCLSAEAGGARAGRRLKAANSPRSQGDFTAGPGFGALRFPRSLELAGVVPARALGRAETAAATAAAEGGRRTELVGEEPARALGRAAAAAATEAAGGEE